MSVQITEHPLRVAASVRSKKLEDANRIDVFAFPPPFKVDSVQIVAQQAQLAHPEAPLEDAEQH